MYKTSNVIAVAGLGAFLAACGTVDYSNKQVTGSDFDKGLYSGYSSLADAEWSEADSRDANKFGARAVAAAAGNRPAPEEIGARDLPADKVGDLTDARSKLIAALNKGAADKLANDASEAQVMFDCWMQEQEENFQPDDIARCRSGFQNAMARIDAGMQPQTAAAPAAAAAAAPKPNKTDFVVYFDFNSATLNQDAQTAVSLIKAEVKPGAKISISGFTDRAGPSEYNDVLAAKRAKTIFTALEQSGVKADIATNVYGETHNAIPTGDGVAEKLNRRVEISVTQ